MDDNNSNLAKDNEVTMTDIFKGKKVAVFGVPAPFTGVCTQSHYPRYKSLVGDFKKKGVESVVCFSVADPYSHHNWGKAMGNDFNEITFLVDDTCVWAKEHGLDRDYTGASLGHRAARFSMIVENGVVKSFNMVEDAEKDAQNLLDQV
jgi:peroxiredoxin